MNTPFVFRTTRKDRVPNAPDAARIYDLLAKPRTSHELGDRLKMRVQAVVANLEALERMGRVRRAEQRAGFQIWERSA